MSLFTETDFYMDNITKQDKSMEINDTNCYIRKVLFGNYIICEINVPECREYILTYSDKVYINTINHVLLIKNNKNIYTVECDSQIRQVFICKIHHDNKTDKLNDNNIETINIIYARCNKSMHGLDSIHRKYINKLNFNHNKITAIKAVAGSGKTTTLLNLAKNNSGKRILYSAFNKSLIEEIRNKIRKEKITNLYPCTFDSLIRDIYIKKYNTEPDIFDLKPQNLHNIVSWFSDKQFYIKKAYINMFTKFCNQDVFVDTNSFCKKFYKAEKPLLKEMWQKALMRNFITFDSLRKIAQMEHWCKDIIDSQYDLIFIDEAQDFDNIMLQILLLDTTIPKVFVGDPRQAIYEWRGSINAFDKLPKDETLTIEFYSTFRIGEPACEKITNEFDDCWMISKNKTHTELIFSKDTPTEKYTYLFRTWKQLLLTAENTSDIWINDFQKQIQFMKNLHSKLKTSKKKIKKEELMDDFSDDLPNFLLSLSEEELNEIITKIENNQVCKSNAMCKMYTIHSYKGLEDNYIKVSADVYLKSKIEFEQKNLYYVAMTRGKKQIIVEPEKQKIESEKQIEPEQSTIDKFLDTGSIDEVKPEKKQSSDKVTLDLHIEGKTIEEISKLRNLQNQTIVNHLIKNINHESIVFNRFMTEEIYNTILDLIKESPNKTLKEYRDNLIKNCNDTITYNQINIVVQLYKK